MSVLDEVLRVNAEFVRTYDSSRATAPVVRRLAVVACMDYRIPLAEAFGLKPGDAYVIRNAGGVVTEDVIRSLLVAHYRLGVEEVLIVNHTECGMQTFRDEELRADIRRRRGTDAIAPSSSMPFRIWRAYPAADSAHQIAPLDAEPYPRQRLHLQCPHRPLDPRGARRCHEAPPAAAHVFAAGVNLRRGTLRLGASLYFLFFPNPPAYRTMGLGLTTELRPNRM